MLQIFRDIPKFSLCIRFTNAFTSPHNFICGVLAPIWQLPREHFASYLILRFLSPSCHPSYCLFSALLSGPVGASETSVSSWNNLGHGNLVSKQPTRNYYFRTCANSRSAYRHGSTVDELIQRWCQHLSPLFHYYANNKLVAVDGVFYSFMYLPIDRYSEIDRGGER